MICSKMTVLQMDSDNCNERLFAEGGNMHQVAILALDGFVSFDLAIPCDLFSRAVSGSKRLYEVCVCAPRPEIKGPLFNLNQLADLSCLERADTVIVPGLNDIDQRTEPLIIKALVAAKARGARLASICTGAFVLAEAGILDGLRATTHWLAVAELAARFPKVLVEQNVLFVDNGQVLSSAGVASGVDLCLHLTRKDFGAAVAADCAREAVVPLEREGGQPQLVKHERPDSGDSLGEILLWLLENLGQKLTVEALAAKFNLSVRTLNRRFHQQTGLSPLQWILSARIRRSQQLLEATALSIEEVAAASGFDSSSSFRERFHRLIGASPSAWRNTYGDARRLSSGK